MEYSKYLSMTIFSFPRHLLTMLFCFGTLIMYPLVIFSNKKIRIAGVIISSLMILALTILGFLQPTVYSTDILSDGEKYQFDDSYKVYLVDKKYGDLTIRYEDAIECYMVHAEFRHAGKTEFVLESPEGAKKEFEISIRRDTYQVKEKNQ